MKTFTFEITQQIPIQAENITDALKTFQKLHPEYQNDDMHKIKDQDEIRIPYAISASTSEVIYYEPGCPFGYNDCILDPMETIAENCKHQSDMTGKKWKPCRKYKGNKDYCPYYDDECK